MKYWIIGIVVLLIGYTILSNLITYTITTHVAISSTPDKVWEVLMKRHEYPEWSPFIVSSEGEAKVGSTLHNTLQFSKDGSMKFSPKVLAVRENSEFRWLGSLGVRGVFDGEHWFTLQDNADGTVTFTQSERFGGVLVPVLLPFIRADTERGFSAMNHALKQRVESLEEES